MNDSALEETERFEEEDPDEVYSILLQLIAAIDRTLEEAENRVLN